MQSFRSAWAANVRNKKKNPDDSSDHESLFGSDNEEIATSEPKADELSWTNKKTVNVVCLAAIAVLMKHVTGMDKFLLGITYSFRSPGQIVGPFTDTLPFGIDMSDIKLTFDGLFASLFKVFHYMKRHGKSCPSSKILEDLKIASHPPVHFEFITNLEREEWEISGISVHDLLYEDSGYCKEYGGFQTTKMGAIDGQHDYDVKFTFVENGSNILGAVRYRKVSFFNSRGISAKNRSKNGSQNFKVH
jgi:hypothetical protein